MKSPLHITNGDHFTNKLQTLKLKGEIITWREMLCEGQTLPNVGSESFWKTRFEFLHRNYKISKAWFVEKTLKEYRTLCNQKKQDRIVLWFEHDLFCQINMLAVLSWLKTHRKNAEISIIHGSKKDKTDKLYSLGTLSNETLLELYKNRVILSRDDIEYADYIWQLYCSDNPMRLENIPPHRDFKFDPLSKALKIHLKRFPTIKNGLNELENCILKTAESQKLKSRQALVDTLIKNQEHYGFGDIQYERAISSLKALFRSFDPVKLTKKGVELLANQTNYYSQLRDTQSYLGGALKYSFLHNTDTDRILKL